VGTSFVISLIKNFTSLSDEYSHKIVPIGMIWDIQQIFDNPLNFSICQKILGADRVIDNCHLTGRFRGAAQSKCNLDYRVNKLLPAFFS